MSVFHSYLSFPPPTLRRYYKFTGQLSARAGLEPRRFREQKPIASRNSVRWMQADQSDLLNAIVLWNWNTNTSVALEINERAMTWPVWLFQFSRRTQRDKTTQTATYHLELIHGPTGLQRLRSLMISFEHRRFVCWNTATSVYCQVQRRGPVGCIYCSFSVNKQRIKMAGMPMLQAVQLRHQLPASVSVARAE